MTDKPTPAMIDAIITQRLAYIRERNAQEELTREEVEEVCGYVDGLRAQVREGDIALEEIEEATPDGYSFNDLRAIARAARRPQPAPTEGGKG